MSDSSAFKKDPFEVIELSKFLDKFKPEIKESNLLKYINKYLSDINAKIVVIENEYIDKDFLIDYCNFYARTFSPLTNFDNRFTTRYHFFSCSPFTKEDFEQNLYSKKITRNIFRFYSRKTY